MNPIAPANAAPQHGNGTQAYSRGKFLGWGKRLHLWDRSMSLLLGRVISEGRVYRIWAASDGGISLLWQDTRGRWCAAFERRTWAHNNPNCREDYCVVYRVNAPAS